MASEAPKNMSQTPKQEVIYNPMEDLRKLQEAVEAKQPSFAEYTKQKRYIEMKVDDPEVQMAYKVFREQSNNNRLLDMTLLIKDPEWVNQILNQNINLNYSKVGYGYFYTIHITYLTKEWLPKSKMIVLKDYNTLDIPYRSLWTSTSKSENNLAIRNLAVFKK